MKPQGSPSSAPLAGAPPGASWGALALVWAIYLCHAVDRSVISIVLTPIAAEFRLDDGEAGLLAGLAHALPFAIAGIPLGYLADRVNRARLLAVLVGLWSGLTALAGAATGYIALLATRAGVGAAEAGGPPTMLALLGEFFDDRRRPLAISIYYTAPFAGLFLGSAAAGRIAQIYDWRTALAAIGVPGVLLAVLAFALLRDPRSGRPAAARAAAPLRDVAMEIVATPGLRSLVAALIVSSIAISSLAAWTPTLLLRAHGLTTGEAGSLSGIVLGLCGGAGAVVGGIAATAWARGSICRLRVMSAAALLTGTPALLFGLFAPTATLAAIGLGLWSLLSTAYVAPAWNLCVTLAPERMRATVLAAALVLSNLVGAGLGPWLVGRVSDALAQSGSERSLSIALTVCAVAALCGAALFALGASSDKTLSKRPPE